MYSQKMNEFILSVLYHQTQFLTITYFIQKRKLIHRVIYMYYNLSEIELWSTFSANVKIQQWHWCTYMLKTHTLLLNICLKWTNYQKWLDIIFRLLAHLNAKEKNFAIWYRKKLVDTIFGKIMNVLQRLNKGQLAIASHVIKLLQWVKYLTSGNRVVFFLIK